jgi:hypothetical protein
VVVLLVIMVVVVVAGEVITAVCEAHALQTPVPLSIPLLLLLLLLSRWVVTRMAP